MVNSGLDSYEGSRCEFYGTTLYSCTCKSYSFRRTCRHVDFKRRKLVQKDDSRNDEYDDALSSIESGAEATVFVERYSERMLDKMKVLGDVFERHGQLYLIE